VSIGPSMANCGFACLNHYTSAALAPSPQRQPAPTAKSATAVRLATSEKRNLTRCIAFRICARPNIESVGSRKGSTQYVNSSVGLLQVWRVLLRAGSVVSSGCVSCDSFNDRTKCHCSAVFPSD
jgi:hypothetical protein